MRTLEERLKAVEDELSIRNLVARYTDAVNQRDIGAFRELWTDDAVWEIGPPLQSRAEGVDEIVALLSRLLQAEKYFMQMTHSGVIEIKGDRATARFVMRERGRGESTYYDCLAVYEDVLVRDADGWRFARRFYHYRFLDQSPFAGDAFPVTK
jgi:ketosteroid isomerase-like protein